jgi:hypothetical protein
MSCAFIDGALEDGYIKEFKTVHPGCSFKYKPMLLEQRAKMVSECGKIRDAAQAELLVASELSKRIKEWDLVDRDGNPVPIEGKTIAKLKFALFNRLAGIVLYGTEGSDDNPNKQTDERIIDAELAAISAVEDRPIGDVRQEATLKN